MMRKMTKEEALHRCASYCSLAERCVSDVAKKLEKWELSQEEQNGILQRLQKEGFLNEERYCRSFVNDKVKFARWGKNKIVYALRAKGVSEEWIGKAIATIDPADNETILETLLRQKLKSVKGKDAYEIRNKLIRFAAGRGFELSSIYKCLESIVQKM